MLKKKIQMLKQTIQSKIDKSFIMIIISLSLLSTYIYLSMYDITVISLIIQIILTLTAAWISYPFPDTIDQNILKTNSRGFAHTIWIPLGLFYISFLLRGYMYLFPIFFGISLGYLSHIVRNLVTFSHIVRDVYAGKNT